MGSFANSLFRIMLGWFQAVVSAIWSAFTSENGNSVFTWIGNNWILIAGILCAIGLVSDLCIYILRWKPFRKRIIINRDKEENEKINAEKRPMQLFREEETDKHPYSYMAGSTYDPSSDEEQTPDLSLWETDPQESDGQEEPAYHDTSLVTNAGYIVPPDSPYRRPEKQQPINTASNPAAVQNAAETKYEYRTVPVMSRRRRRINVNELFSDPEEELHTFEAPQQIIDSRQAYREPVYPRGWKKSEDTEE